MSGQYLACVSRNTINIHTDHKSTSYIPDTMRIYKRRRVLRIAFLGRYITPEYLPKLIKSLALKITTLIIKVKFEVLNGIFYLLQGIVMKALPQQR